MLKSLNLGLNKAAKAKKDEFYTQLVDIEKELKHYKDKFYGKIVYCNCDDPFESNFFKYFANNFNSLGLKKLITTSYVNSPIAGADLPLFKLIGLKQSDKGPFRIEINEVPDTNRDGAKGINDVEYLLQHEPNTAFSLQGNGDFRSKESIELLEEADIVVTNPPFSLFREYIAQLIDYKKNFLIIGNINAVSYKDCFKHIKENKMWLGPSIHSGDREFRVPDDYPLNAAGYRIDNNGKKYIRVKGIRWFTNLDHNERHKLMDLYKSYTPKEYPKFDNYEAINVNVTAEIPKNYKGAMGVPITFLDKYNPEQFEIIGIDRYVDDNPNYGRRFSVDGKEIYARILIKIK